MSQTPDKPEDQRQRDKRDKIQRQLDEALEDSFPASDPVSIVTSNSEEDWGTDPTPPAPPPTQPKGR